MITGAVITAVLACLDAVFSLVPGFSFTPGDTHGDIAIVSELNGIIPIQTCVTLILLTFGLILIQRGWDLIVFVFHQFWGSD